jgi:hypothetical protein
MRHLRRNAFGRHGVGSHRLGGTGKRCAKGRHLVDSNEDNVDANEKGTGCSLPVLGMCGNIGNRHAAEDGNRTFNCRFGCKFEVDFH